MNGRGLLVIATILIGSMLLVGCSSPSEPKPFPPPAGYESWDEYYEEYYKEAGPPPTTSEKPALTSAEQAYASAVVNQTSTVSKALGELGELCQNPQIGNDEWTLRVATQIVIMRGTYDEAMELDPPSSMAEIHLKYIQAMKHFNDSTYLLTQGIDDLDPDLFGGSNNRNGNWWTAYSRSYTASTGI